MIANTRELAAQSDKRNPQDFALWKKAEPQHIMRWPSPWSDGFPGWHLECTVMSTKYLGEEFDIHGGGMDLKFPHHECEIAQGEAATCKDPVHYWMHANMLTLNGKKMAKSTGNNILPEELFSGKNEVIGKAFSPNVARFFMLQAHYRSILDFSKEALSASEKGFNRLIEAYASIDDLPESSASTINLAEWKQSCYDAMNDDFNSPILIAKLFDAVKWINAIKEESLKISAEDKLELKQVLHDFLFDILGLRDGEKSLDNNSDKLSGAVELLIKLRAEARNNRDFATSDKIRDQLQEMGIQLKDGKDGTTFSIN